MPAMPASSLELDQEPRRKRFLGGTHPCDSIGTVASQLTAVVYYEEKQISIPRPPQRIGLDAADAATYDGLLITEEPQAGSKVPSQRHVVTAAF